MVFQNETALQNLYRVMVPGGVLLTLAKKPEFDDVSVAKRKLEEALRSEDPKLRERISALRIELSNQIRHLESTEPHPKMPMYFRYETAIPYEGQRKLEIRVYRKWFFCI
jgi:hypothetical protein